MRLSWDKLIFTHTRGSIFQTPEMLEIYTHTPSFEPLFISAVDSNNNIIGVLLAGIQKEHSGILGKFSARSIIWGGPLVQDENPEILDLILKEYVRKIKGKAIYTQFRNLWDWSNDERLIFLKNGFRYEEHLDILFDLNKPENILFNEIHKGRRKNIGRAIRYPLEFSEVASYNEFQKCLNLIEQTYKKVKLPYPGRSFFNNADKMLSEKVYLRKFVAKYQSEIISCRFVLCYKELVYDWFSGTDESHLDKYPNDFLPWKIIQWSKEHNYRIFDFGGAGHPNKTYSVRDFKLKFGGNLVSFGRYNKIHNKNLYRIGKVGFEILKKIRFNVFI
jgi:serine/alanine adding enzyme